MERNRDDINYYYSCGGKLGEVTKGGESASFLYDGSLLTSDTRAGTVNAALSWGYDSDLRPSTFTYAGGTVSFGYDNDSLLTSASGFTIIRNAQNGLPLTVSDASLSQTRTFSGYGEVDGVAVSAGGTSAYAWTVTRDNAGRILHRTEMVAGSPIAWAYRYDEVGRLVEVKKDGVVVESYGFDLNGNRTSEGNLLRGISRTLEYDLEDKVIVAGADSYALDLDGFLTSRVTAEGLATFDYSSRGELLTASLPAYGATVARTVTYLHDPMGRRIAKQVNGVTVEKYLWGGATTLLAVYDGGGSLRDRYIYADGRLPVAMDRGGSRYYLLTDQVGTVRAVADATGAVVKRVDYDSFGNVLADSNPGFPLPFGFAGGLHDRDTGLVRFGARDYDPAIGRWTAKDPIDFAGGDENLGAYCGNDSVNFIDPKGLKLRIYGTSAEKATLLQALSRIAGTPLKIDNCGNVSGDFSSPKGFEEVGNWLKEIIGSDKLFGLQFGDAALNGGASFDGRMATIETHPENYFYHQPAIIPALGVPTPWTLEGLITHEIVGHALDFARGRSESSQVDANKRANKVYKLLNIPLRDPRE